MATIISAQSFELESGGGQYVDTGDQSVDHDLVNNSGQSPVDSTPASTGTLGFDASYENTRNDVGLTDGDFAGVTSFTGGVGSFTDGTQGYQFSDPDGAHILTFDEVNISTFNNVSVSIDYFIQETGWEADDVVSITVNTDVGSVTILDTAGSDIDDLGIEGAFTTGVVSIPDAATTAQLVVKLDSNSSSEAVYIDNILFQGDETTNGGSDFDLQITELWPGNEPGSNLSADWFELTNVGTAAWVSGVDPDLFYDDDSQDPTVADVIQGITQIDPGESVVVIVGEEGDVVEFESLWSPVIELTDVEVGFTDGSGLGQGSDGVSLFVGTPMAGDTPVDFEPYPDANAFGGQSYDVDLGAFSVAGQDGAVATQQLNDEGQPAVGSPGNGNPIAVTPTFDLVFSEIMFNPASAEDDWEWVELFNAGSNVVDLSGFVLDDINSVAVSAANITSGVIQPGETAILYNADDVTAADFTAAWGTGINLIAVTEWSALGLNNGGDTVGLWDSFASYTGDNTVQANALISVAYPNIDDGSGSVYLTDLTDPTSFVLSTDGTNTPAGGTTYTSQNAGGNSGSDVGSPGGFVSAIEAPTPSDPEFFQFVGGLTGLSGAEITAFDPSGDRLFVVDGSNSIQVFDLSNPASPVADGTITVSGTINSVAVSNGVVAVAIQSDPVTDPGTVAFYDTSTRALLDSTTVGALPDMLTFTPDGAKVLVANEGEPDGGIDPEGSISVIDFNGTAITNVATADFSGFDAATLRAAGVRIFPGKTAAEDLEPEYIAVSDDGATAFVTLQENNAVAVVDVATATVTAIQPLGTQDHSVAGNELDASDRDGIVGNLQTQPVLGLYQPDAIATFTVNGQTYTITADEGDARDEDARISDLTLDPTAFPNAAELQQDENLGRLQVSTIDGDTDGDGDFDQLVAYGGRSFTIRDAAGNIVFNSGNQLEAIAVANVSDTDGLDGRSDNKGPEPEGVTTGVIDGRTYAFIGLERAEGVTVYDVTDPTAPVFVQYLTNAGDSEPEGVTFISRADSPTGENLLVVANEDSNTISIYANGTPTGTETTLISAIQGAGASSPLEDQTVTVEAIVVGDFQDGSGANGDLNGFFIQEEDADADGNANTSEGIFVFDGSAPGVDVNVGDTVRVTGTVSEFFGETQLSNVTVEVLDSSDSSGLVTPATITFPVASTVTNSDGDLIADLEAFEGMLVTIPQDLTVSDLFTLGRFGDMGLHADGRLETFTQANAPSVSGFQAFQDLAVRNTVILDDGRTEQNPATIPFDVASAPGDVAGQLDANDELRSGDTVSDLTGVVRFSRGSGGSGDAIYRINPTIDPVFVNDNPRPTSAPDVGGDLTVASFNVLNFFTSLDDDRSRNNNPLNAGPSNLEPRGANDLTTAPDFVAPSTQAQTDSLAEFNRQVDKLVASVSEIGADIFGLVELENEFGDQNGDGLFSIQFLVDELNAAIPGATYTFVDPGQGFVDTGDAISVGLIYNANTVGITPGTSVEILDDSDLAGLGLGSLGTVFDGPSTNRAALATTFTEVATGESFTVSVNHFKSKGGTGTGGDANQNDGVGSFNQTRLNGAIALDAWLDSNPTGSDDDDILIIGDLNAYAMEDPIQFLLGEGYEDQVKAFLEPGEFEYSFGFPVDLGTSPQVQAFGALDYALASPSLSAQITGTREWHTNADEAVIFDYNLEFKPQAQADGLFAANPFRASDHDPIIIGLDLASANTNPDAVDDSGTGFTTTAGVAFTTANVLDNDSDADSDDVLTITAVNIAGTVGEVQDNGDGTFDYDPNGQFDLAPGETATDRFSYTISDGNGGTDTATVTLTITGAEEPDEVDLDIGLFDATTDTLITVIEDGTQIQASDIAGRQVTIAALVPDDSPFFDEVDSMRANFNQGQVIQVENAEPYSLFGDRRGDFRGQSDVLALGDNTITFSLFSRNRLRGEFLGDVTRTFSVVDDLSGDPPMATDDTLTVTESEGVSLDLNVLSNDVSGTGDPIAVVEVAGAASTVGRAVTGSNGGRFTLNSDGTADFDANGDFEFLAVGETATTTVEFGVGYANGLGAVVASELVVTVDGENDRPMAADDAVEVQGSTVIEALLNDSDPDASDELAIVDVTQPENGTVELNGDQFIFTPDASFSGSDRFTYTVADGNGGTDTATVTLAEEIIGAVPLVVGLFNTETDTLIETISQGETVIVPSGQNLSLAATVPTDSPLFGQVESVVLDLNGGEVVQTENVEPYALFGDRRGDFFNGSLPLGSNTIQLEAFSRNRAKGELLGTTTLDFTLVTAEV